MSNNINGNSIYGIDRDIIEAAMQRGRRERSKAFWALLQAIFGRPEASNDETLAAGRKGIPAHC